MFVHQSGVSFKNTDLSEVTSFKDCNLKNTNFIQATLPNNPIVLTDSYNLDKAIPKMSIALISEQQNRLIDKAVDQVFLYAKSEGTMNLPNKEDYSTKIKELSNNNPVIREYITEKLNLSPINLVNRIPPKIEQLRHFADYANTPSQILTPLYENITNNHDIQSNIIANIISEKVAKKLFNNGDNRGQDSYMTQQIIKEVVADMRNKNPKTNIEEFLEPKNQEILTKNIASILQSKSKYTVAGMATGGIYLPNIIFNSELKNKLREEFTKSSLYNEVKNIGATIKHYITLEKDNNKFSKAPNFTPHVLSKHTEGKGR